MTTESGLEETFPSTADLYRIDNQINFLVHSRQGSNCLIDFRERENVNLLFHPFTHSEVVSGMCPDWRSDPQPRCMGTTR